MTVSEDDLASGVAVLPAKREPASAPALTPRRGRSDARMAPPPSTAARPAPSTASQPAPSTAPQPAPSKTGRAAVSGPAWGVQLVVLITGVFMSILDTSIVNVAIPVIR